MSSTEPNIHSRNTSPSSDSSLSSSSGDAAPVAIEHSPHATQSPNSAGDSTEPEYNTQGSQNNLEVSTTAPVSERKMRFLEPDGRLEETFLKMVGQLVGGVRFNVVEDRIEFREALLAGELVEMTISEEISGVWRTFVGRPSEPRGYARVPRDIAADLTAKCDALIELFYLHRITYETANSFCEALRAVMEPLVEQYLSGSLQLKQRLHRKTVAVMPRDVRDALARALDRADAGMVNYRLSEEAVKRVLEAMDVALGAIGRPAMPIARSQPHKSPGPAIPEYDGYFSFMPCEFKVLKKALAAGTLDLATLRHTAGLLRMRLMAQI